MRVTFCLLISLALLISLSRLQAQETTATLSGSVVDAKGTPVPGATVSVLYVPTNYRLATQTNNKGIFVLPNLKPGGPYTIRITFVGFEDQQFDNVNLSLGVNPELKINLTNSTSSLQEVVVQAARRPTTAGLTLGSR